MQRGEFRARQFEIIPFMKLVTVDVKLHHFTGQRYDITIHNGDLDDIVGLIPTAEFDGKNPSDILQVEETLELVVVNVDAKDHKLILSFKDGKKKDSKEKEPESDSETEPDPKKKSEK